MTKQKMKYSSKHFMKGSEEKKVVAGEGIIRQNLGFDDSLFLARVNLKATQSATLTHTRIHRLLMLKVVCLILPWVQKPGVWKQVTALISHPTPITEPRVWKPVCYWIFSVRYVRTF